MLLGLLGGGGVALLVRQPETEVSVGNYESLELVRLSGSLCALPRMPFIEGFL